MGVIISEFRGEYYFLSNFYLAPVTYNGMRFENNEAAFQAAKCPERMAEFCYLNPCFGDLWVVDGTSFIKINNGYAIDLDEPEGFVKVGHIDGVINRRRTNDSQGYPSKSSS